jgi:hypothetical protein
MPSGPAALQGLTRLNVLLTLAAVKESPQVLVGGCVSGTVLSSKRAKKLIKFVWEQDIGVHDGAGFLFVIHD